MALVCVSTYIRSKDFSLPHLFAFLRPFHSNHLFLFPVSNQPCAHNHSFSLSYSLSRRFVSRYYLG